MDTESMRILIDFLGNICVVAITIYTFYLTFLSKKVKIIGCTTKHSVFEGERLSFTLHNYSMQAFDISRVYLICDKTRLIPISLKESVVLEPRKSLVLEIPPYTRLMEDVNVYSKEYQKHWCLVLGSDIGCIYASARKWDIGQSVIRKVEKNQYRRVGVVRLEVDGIVVSEQVRYVIRVYTSKYVTHFLMTDYGFTDKPIDGCNVFEKYVGRKKKLRKVIAKRLNIPKGCISIEDLNVVDSEQQEPFSMELIDTETGKNLLEGVDVDALQIGD